jgi:hypothetical protein
VKIVAAGEYKIGTIYKKDNGGRIAFAVEQETAKA